jgi:hypothetical protein
VVFCPKCGDVLHERVNARGVATLYCATGDLWYAPVLAERLRERFGSDRGPDAGESWSVSSLSETTGLARWCCPGCRTPLTRHAECPRCGKSLAGLAFSLIERHPHRNPFGDGFI